MTQKPNHPTQLATVVQSALGAEADVGYWVESGRYWEAHDQFDRQTLRDIDSLWLATAPEMALA